MSYSILSKFQYFADVKILVYLIYATESVCIDVFIIFPCSLDVYGIYTDIPPLIPAIGNTCILFSIVSLTEHLSIVLPSFNRKLLAILCFFIIIMFSILLI